MVTLSSDPTRDYARASLAAPRVLSRIVQAGLICLCLFSAYWACATLPSALLATELGGYAGRIAAGETFKKDSLLALRPKLDRAEATPSVRPEIARSVALVELRLAEIELQDGATIAGNPQFERAERSVRAGLASNPRDAFLWYALFWLDKTQRGFSPSSARLLAMSYRTGPHEGWIAVHRNRAAVSVLGQLPEPLRKTVVAEFRNLVSASYLDDAASILAGPGWPERDQLLAGLSALPEEQRLAFSRRLENRDLSVAVPGISRKARRPWDFAPG